MNLFLHIFLQMSSKHGPLAELNSTCEASGHLVIVRRFGWPISDQLNAKRHCGRLMPCIWGKWRCPHARVRGKSYIVSGILQINFNNTHLRITRVFLRINSDNTILTIARFFKIKKKKSFILFLFILF